MSAAGSPTRAPVMIRRLYFDTFNEEAPFDNNQREIRATDIVIKSDPAARAERVDVTFNITSHPFSLNQPA